jgi:hypothetical protein
MAMAMRPFDGTSPVDAERARVHFGFTDHAVPTLNHKDDDLVRSCRRFPECRLSGFGTDNKTRPEHKMLILTGY